MKRVLVLLIGEVLTDPRVYKTCLSLAECGCEVTIGCTNPARKPQKETINSLSIIRFPHREEFILKRMYQWLQSNLHPSVGNLLSNVHEKKFSSPLKNALRNCILSLNHTHFIKSTMNINSAIVRSFSGESFDLVHCNDVDTLHAGCELKRLGSVQYLLYDAHEYWPGMGVTGSETNTANRDLEARGVQEADFIVTVNSPIADLLREEYHLTSTPSVIMNCPYRYDGVLTVDRVNSPVRIIYQGKLQAFRGLPELVLAFKHIDNGILTLSGYGPLLRPLKRLVMAEGLHNKVTFTGYYDPYESVRICANHDVGVMPFPGVTLSTKYSSPNKLFDYSMAGLALAASNLPCLAMFIEPFDMGKLFKNIDSDHIAETLNWLIDNPAHLLQYKRNARKSAYEKFYWEKQFSENYPFLPHL
jgi:glycogen synthase